MLKQIILYASLMVLITACNDNKTAEQPPTATDAIDTTGIKPQTETVENLPELPPYVVFQNWQMGDPKKAQFILNLYKAWDSDDPADMASYFADSTTYDLPDGKRVITTTATIESTLRKWRKGFKETSNTPFSLISLYNKDLDQEWVIAWTWNKWSYKDGVRDSMLYCDNWRFKDGKIKYLNSLENRASKSLSMKLNKDIPK